MPSSGPELSATKWFTSAKVTASTEKYILAIDLGTSGPKSALISTRGEVIDYEFENVDLLILPEGRGVVAVDALLVLKDNLDER